MGGASVSVTAEPLMPISWYSGVIICAVTYDEHTLSGPITLYSPGAGLCVTMDTDGTCNRPNTACGTDNTISVTCNNKADTRGVTIRLLDTRLEFPGDYGTYTCNYQKLSETVKTSNVPCE